MNNRKDFNSKEHCPETALTQEIDLLSLWAAADEQKKTFSDFEAITEQLHVAPDTLATTEIDLSRRRCVHHK